MQAVKIREQPEHVDKANSSQHRRLRCAARQRPGQFQARAPSDGVTSKREVCAAWTGATKEWTGATRIFPGRGVEPETSLMRLTLLNCGVLSGLDRGAGK